LRIKTWTTRGLRWISLLAVVLAAYSLVDGEPRETRLQQVLERGKLVLLTRNGASSYFLGANGPTGPEYELARQFADFLGVKLEVRVAGSFASLADMLEDGKGDLIGANLTRNAERERRFRFGPDYAETRTEIVYRRDLPMPTSLNDLVGRRVAVIAGSSYETQLKAARQTVPGLRWEARDDVGVEDLLLAIDHGDLDATLVDANVFSINQQFYPSVDVAFSFAEPQPQAWAFVRDDDDSLVQKAEVFLRIARDEGRLAAIQHRFFDDRRRLDQVGMLHFMEKVRKRLPGYLGTFRQVARTYGIDWRLLAAMGYQESHWDESAASPTGVRGLMMLTRNTASQLGLDDRLDPQQSILGGALYLQRMLAKIPARIPAPDRTWMALAAYNMGYGHLEDARVLTQHLGGNPDSWNDVRKNLPLLTQEKYYETARHGYARGHEAQRYVRNIRSYYDVLTWMDTREHPLLMAQQTVLAP